MLLPVVIIVALVQQRNVSNEGNHHSVKKVPPLDAFLLRRQLLHCRNDLIPVQLLVQPGKVETWVINIIKAQMLPMILM